LYARRRAAEGIEFAACPINFNKPRPVAEVDLESDRFECGGAVSSALKDIEHVQRLQTGDIARPGFHAA
jgi:hypothetical protein